MTTYRKNVREMLAEQPSDLELDRNADARAPSEASLRGSDAVKTWCKLSVDEQLRRRAERDFERKLGAEVRRRHEDGWSSGRLDSFVAAHRAKFEAKRRAAVAPEDPCKIIPDSPFAAELGRIFEQSRREWGKRFPYLLHDGPCECTRCSPGLARMRRASAGNDDPDLGRLDDFGPTSYQETA
jgi:hypothetical protein